MRKPRTRTLGRLGHWQKSNVPMETRTITAIRTFGTFRTFLFYFYIRDRKGKRREEPRKRPQSRGAVENGLHGVIHRARKCPVFLVGARGFEPPTLCSQSRMPKPPDRRQSGWLNRRGSQRMSRGRRSWLGLRRETLSFLSSLAVYPCTLIYRQACRKVTAG